MNAALGALRLQWWVVGLLELSDKAACTSADFANNSVYIHRGRSGSQDNKVKRKSVAYICPVPEMERTGCMVDPGLCLLSLKEAFSKMVMDR